MHRPRRSAFTALAVVLPLTAATASFAQSITNLGVGSPDHDLSRAVGVSADGRFVTGISAGSSSSTRAYRWSADGGFEFFGAPNSTTPYGISGDGSTVVGQGDSYPTSGGAFRWSSGAIQIIGGSGWFATAANSDASVIVGAGGSYGRYAVRWVNGTQQYLGSLSSGAGSTALAVSSDGSTVVAKREVVVVRLHFVGIPLAGCRVSERLPAAMHLGQTG